MNADVIAAKSKNEAQEKGFVVGSDTHFGELSPEGIKSCSKCGKVLYFMDVWDWERFDSICTECVSGQGIKGAEFQPLTKQTIESVRRLTGISVKEVKDIRKKMLKDFAKR